MQGTGGCKVEGWTHFLDLNGHFTKFGHFTNSKYGLFIHHFKQVTAKQS